MTRVQVQADECMKMLFSLSDQPTLDLLNGLFGETFSMENAKVLWRNTQFVGQDVSLPYANSLLVVLREKEQKKYRVEFQAFDGSSLLIRMFESRYQITKQDVQNDLKQLVMLFPHQVVLCFDRNALEQMKFPV